MLSNNSSTNLNPHRWLSSQVHRNPKQKVMGAVVNLKSYLIQKLPNKRQRKALVSTLSCLSSKFYSDWISCNFRQWNDFFYDLLLLSFFLFLAKKVTMYRGSTAAKASKARALPKFWVSFNPIQNRGQIMPLTLYWALSGSNSPWCPWCRTKGGLISEFFLFGSKSNLQTWVSNHAMPMGLNSALILEIWD